MSLQDLYPHVAAAIQYAEDVVAKRVPACLFVRQACQRQLDDLDRVDRPYVFDAETAEHACAFMERLPHIKGEWAKRGELIRLEPWQAFIQSTIFGWVYLDDVVIDGEVVGRAGRRRFRTAYIEIPRKNSKSTLAAGTGLYCLSQDGESGGEVYCLHPETLVLCSDLRWRPVEDLGVGDDLVAFDEHPPKRPETYRKFRTASVTSTKITKRPCKLIRFQDGGEVIASDEHLWLATQSSFSNNSKWTRTDDVLPGSRIRYLGAPWSEDRSRDGGWLAGIFDGEGCIGTGHGLRSGCRISVTQKPGAVLDEIQRALAHRQYHTTGPYIHKGSGVGTVHVSRAYDCLRFLGSVRPLRLVSQSKRVYEGRALNRSQHWRAVRDVVDLGVQSVVALGTSTKTLIADGLFSHNSNATTRDQAKIVFDVARQMALRAPLGIGVRAHSVFHEETGSLFKPLHAQGETLDGYNISCALNDELHAWHKKAVYDVIETAMSAREQPLIYNITTAGDNLEGVCFDVRGYAVRLLSRVIDDDSFFGIIYTIDDTDRERWFERECWRKANPNWGVSVYPWDVEAMARKAREVPSQQNAFLTKRLNVWVNAAVAWMDMVAWQKGFDGSLKLEDFRGLPCYAGIDLASKIDVNSLALIFEVDRGGKKHYYVFTRHWLPEEAVKQDRYGQYDGWIRMGAMRKTEGNVVDLDLVEEEIVALSKEHKLVELGIDPGHSSTQVGVHMMKAGIKVVDVRPTVLNFSEPMKWLEAWVKDGVMHFNDPVLSWMVSNVVAHRDQKDNLYPRKESATRKIDGIVALLIAINRMKGSSEGKSYQMLFV